MDRGLKSILFKQIHDSMVVDIYPGEQEIVTGLMKEAMENAPAVAKNYGVDITVPLHCDIKIGDNWGQVEDLPVAA